jgi:hypothetical protein
MTITQLKEIISNTAGVPVKELRTLTRAKAKTTADLILTDPIPGYVGFMITDDGDEAGFSLVKDDKEWILTTM